MSDSVRSTPGWLRWTCRILGVLWVAGAGVGFILLALKVRAIWLLAQAAHKPFTATMSMDLITHILGEFMGNILGLFFGLWLTNVGSKKKKKEQDETSVIEAPPSTAAIAAKAAHRAASKRWQSCNVLQIGAEKRRIWSFGAGKGGFNLTQEQSVPTASPLPLSLVGRDWKTLLQPKLNIAWLPVDQVFLRVAQLPESDFDETLAMVELQLEKLSPLPVTQIVWSIQILPQRVDNLQTIIVIIMARDLVEKFLGELEGQGYLADRLELPILDQMQATTIKSDGAYIYPDVTTGKFSALVAWWYGGTLRNLGLLHVPMVEHRDAILKEQLTQMAWSGELEGWLTGEPRWYLVADEETAANWQPLFRPWLGHAVEVLSPVSATQLATLNANRAARAEAGAGILPSEYSTRYQQEFVDRLWMRLLGTVLVVYLAGVVIYLAGATVQSMRADSLVADVSGRSRAYTNVLQIKAQLEILKNRQALKFASLDCWKKTAELLPENISVGTLEFKDGKYSLSGVAPGDQSPQLNDFNDALRKATLDGQPMFDSLALPTSKLNPGGATISWSFSGDLAHAEEVK